MEATLHGLATVKSNRFDTYSQSKQAMNVAFAKTLSCLQRIGEYVFLEAHATQVIQENSNISSNDLMT
jgi:hypothetical protein